MIHCQTVAYWGGVWDFQPPPSLPKFRSFDKAEPYSQFRGKYVRNNLTMIWLSLIFWVVSWKALPASYDPPTVVFFFLSKAWRDVSIKYQKLRKFYHMKWNFLYQITAASRTPDLGATAPRYLFSLSSVLNWICWTPRKKFMVTPLLLIYQETFV